MAKLNRKYHIGELAGLQKEEILKSVSMETVYPGVYFVTVSSNPSEQLDIVTSERYFSKKNENRMEIVGIAYGKTEAFILVRDIADEVYRKKTAGSIREYFGQHG